MREGRWERDGEYSWSRLAWSGGMVWETGMEWGSGQPRGPVKVGSAMGEMGKQELEAGRPSGQQQQSLLGGAGFGRLPLAQF